MQRHALLMYTSCGWFFDELSGLETVQVLHYAGRALRLAKDSTGRDLEPEFVGRLQAVKSNLPEQGDGARIYEKYVKPAYVSIERLAAHFSISSLFENFEDKSQIYCYEVERDHFSIEADGKLRLGMGRARFGSRIIGESEVFSFAAVHLGEHNVIAGVRPSKPDEDEAVRKNLSEIFSRADIAEIIRVLDEAFAKQTFSLRSLFRDEQRKIVDLILAESLASSNAAYGSIYESQAPLIRFLYDLSIPVPSSMKGAAEIALNNKVRAAFERPEIDASGIESYFREAAASHINLDVATLEFAIRKRLEREAGQLADHLDNIENVRKLRQLLDIIMALPFPVVLWEAENNLFGPLTQPFKGNTEDPDQKVLSDELNRLRERLKIVSPGGGAA
jgi:hypothetical protein